MTRTSVCLPGERGRSITPCPTAAARPEVAPGTPSQLSVGGIVKLNGPVATWIPDGLRTLPSRARLARARNFAAHCSRPALVEAKNGGCSTVEHSFEGESMNR